MLIAAVAALILAVGVPLGGGKLSTLGRLRLRGLWLVPVALGVQIVIISVVDDPPLVLSRSLHVGTYLFIAMLMWLNRRVPWMWVIAVGGASNFLVIAVNDGVMPASAAALRTAGLTITEEFSNSATVHRPHLRFLGDVFGTPQALPLANVFSIGDVVILIGLGLVSITVSRTSPSSTASFLRPDAASVAAPEALLAASVEPAGQM